MSPRIFSTTQREELRIKMLDAGFELIKQHGMTHADWGGIPPQQVRLDTLITTQKTLNLETLLAEDSTFYGDLFPHVVKWGGELYLEDGVHRALRNALHRRAVMYARVLDLDSISPALLPGARN